MGWVIETGRREVGGEGVQHSPWMGGVCVVVCVGLCMCVCVCEGGVIGVCLVWLFGKSCLFCLFFKMIIMGEYNQNHSNTMSFSCYKSIFSRIFL